MGLQRAGRPLRSVLLVQISLQLRGTGAACERGCEGFLGSNRLLSEAGSGAAPSSPPPIAGPMSPGSSYGQLEKPGFGGLQIGALLGALAFFALMMACMTLRIARKRAKAKRQADIEKLGRSMLSLGIGGHQHV